MQNVRSTRLLHRSPGASFMNATAAALDPVVAGSKPVRVGTARTGRHASRPSPPYIVCTRDLGQYWVGNQCYIAWSEGFPGRPPGATRFKPRSSHPLYFHFSALSPKFRGTPGLTLTAIEASRPLSQGEPAYRPRFTACPSCTEPSRAPSCLAQWCPHFSFLTSS